MRKRIAWIILSAVLVLIALAGCMSPPQEPPWSADGTVLSLPFPINDERVGINSADIYIAWGERESTIYDISYRGNFFAEYTLQYMGYVPATVEIAMAIPALDAVSWLGRTSPGYDFRAYVDGQPIAIRSYSAPTNIDRSGPENLAERETLVLAGMIDDARTNIAGINEPFIPDGFEADGPATLYAFEIEPVESITGMLNRIEFTVHYDPNATTVIVRTSRETDRMHITHQYNAQTGEMQLNFAASTNIMWRPIENFEMLIIGEDTLRWSAEPSFRSSVEEGERRAFASVENYIYVRAEEITPRDYFRRLQFERVGFGDLLMDKDYLMRRVDHDLRLFGQPSFSLLGRELRALEDLRVTNNPNVFIAEIPFVPGQERVFSVAFAAYSGTQWYGRDENISLFHHSVLLETAAYWDFVNQLTITAHHPYGVIESAFSHDFVTTNDISTFRIQNPTENIHIGFVLEDERPRQGFNLGGLLLVILAVLFVGGLLSIALPFLGLVWLVGMIAGIVLLIRNKKTP